MRTAIYDSTSADSLVALAEIMEKYPYTDAVDVAGKNKSEIDALIAALDSGQDAIYTLVKSENTDYVAAVAGTAVATLTAGAANEIGALFVDDGTGNYCIGSYKSAGGTDTDDAVLAKAAINAGTHIHGYSADNTLGVLTISAPAADGALANAYVLTANVDTGGTLAIAITTDFDSTGTGSGTGVTGVAFTDGQLQTGQVTTLTALLTSGSTTELYTSGGKNTCLRTWEYLHGTSIVAPRVVTMLGGYNTVSTDANYITILETTIPTLLSSTVTTAGVWKALLNLGNDTFDSTTYIPKQDIELLNKLSGYDFTEATEKLLFG